MDEKSISAEEPIAETEITEIKAKRKTRKKDSTFTGPAHMSVRLIFVEPILGTWPGDEDLFRRFIGQNSPDAVSIEDEIATFGIDDVVDKQKTIFCRDPEGNPAYLDYQIKGFFKDTCSGLRRVPGTHSSKLTAFKKIIDKLIFPCPRFIPIKFDGEIGECQRPLRASTAQGERVSIAISEEIPAGATISFRIQFFDNAYRKLIEEWLDYGIYSGLGQWRNSGKGRFTWEEIDDAEIDEQLKKQNYMNFK